MKVVVVDDSVFMRKTIVAILTEIGATRVVEALDGAEGVKKVEEEDPDLVIMDWVMPNMSGVEAVKLIRASGNKVPIIMCTTETEKNYVVDAITAGADDYVIKPFSPEVFVKKVKQTLEKASS